MTIPDVEILLPVYNEAESIEATIREIHQELSSKLNVGFIICEDGSKDNTKQILRQLAETLPLRLNLSDARKGYSRAVRDGMHMLESDFLLCLDSDGQCDPKDFWEFWKFRASDVVLGWRVERADNAVRRIFSRFFYRIYQVAFHTAVHDPSCPYVLMKKPVARRLVDELGAMQQGFWWEFVARAHRRGFQIKELPVHHRLRSAGVTQVYRWRKMPGIFFRHVAAIFRIWSETRTVTSPETVPVDAPPAL
jgi:dolichol-phosphate mannosyltransferase